MSKKNQHVVITQKGEWSVRASGASRASKNFDNKSEAITYARNRAKGDGAELYIHGRDGRILERNTYGNSPFPSKSPLSSKK